MKLRTKIILAAVGITSTIYFYKCYKDYYAEYDFVKNELNKIEGIKIISIDGNPDLRLEVYSATIELKDGNTLMFKCNMSEKGFKDMESIDILRINNWGFHRIGWPNNGTSESFDVGQRSDYNEIRKLNIKNIREAVEHFDEINNLLKNISTYPDFDTLQEKSGHILFQKYDDRKITDTRVLKGS